MEQLFASNSWFVSFRKIETSESYGIPLLHKILASKIERHSQNKESSSSCFLYILSSLPGRRYFRCQVSKSLNRKQLKMWKISNSIVLSSKIDTS